MYKKLFIYIFFIAASSSPIFSKEFHLLIMGDTKDKHIGDDVKIDVSEIQSHFSKVATACKTVLHTKRLVGSLLTRQNVEIWIEKEPIANDDVVIFYYSGHGFRKWQDGTLWPRGHFPLKHEQVNFCRLIEKLFARSAAFYLIVFDCCNTFVNDRPLKTIYEKIHLQFNTAKTKKLFLKKYGFVIVTAASPGETAGARENEIPEGSCFTRRFFDALAENTQQITPRWCQIFETINKVGCEYHSQTAKYFVYLRKHKRKTEEYAKILYKRSAYGPKTYPE